MGRKIPGKKHRGVKDPATQQLRRELLLKDKVNAPPTKVDYQEVPKSVLEIGRLKELAKKSKGQFKNKKRARRKQNGDVLLDLGNLNAAGPKLSGMRHKDKNMPRLQQKPGESDQRFLQRVDNATSELISEVKMEAQHNIVINRNRAGDVVNVEKGKKTLDEATRQRIRKSVVDFHKGKTPLGETTKKEKKEMKKIMHMRSTNQPPQGRSEKKRLGKKQRLKMKQAPKKLEKELDGLERRYEQVHFGEVVHEPPHIKKRPRGVDPASKPRVDGLLLTSLMKPNSEVSMASKKRIEEQRLAVVQAYRDLKAAKRNTHVKQKT